MAKKIMLSNGREWSTQAAALAHFKTMLARYSDGDAVEDRFDHDDLLALLERYDCTISTGPSKMGVGVERFSRQLNTGEGYATSGFWVERADGTKTDFSYLAAVKGQPKSSEQEFYDACRNAIAPELRDAKKRHFAAHADSQGRVPCDMTDELVTIENAHLDHAWPTFSQLVLMFRAARGWQHGTPQGILTEPSDAQTTTSFTDRDIERAFCDYHRAGAILRIVSKGQNLKMAARQRKPKVRRPIKLE